MKEIETGKEKVRKICDLLRRDTIEPAKQEASQIIEQAKARAEEIVRLAQEEAERIKTEASAEMDRQKKIFTAALHQGAKQVVESLKNEIENTLFSPTLAQCLHRPMTGEDVILDLIKAVVTAVEKEGVEADLDVWVPKTVSKQKVTDLLVSLAGEKLQAGAISIGEVEGGVALKLSKENITIDITDQAIKEWMCKYIRQDFRKVLFGV